MAIPTKHYTYDCDDGSGDTIEVDAPIYATMPDYIRVTNQEGNGMMFDLRGDDE